MHTCIQRDRDKGTVSLDEKKHIKQVFIHFHMNKCNGVSTRALRRRHCAGAGL